MSRYRATLSVTCRWRSVYCLSRKGGVLSFLRAYQVIIIIIQHVCTPTDEGSDSPSSSASLSSIRITANWSVDDAVCSLMEAECRRLGVSAVSRVKKTDCTTVAGHHVSDSCWFILCWVSRSTFSPCVTLSLSNEEDEVTLLMIFPSKLESIRVLECEWIISAKGCGLEMIGGIFCCYQDFIAKTKHFVFVMNSNMTRSGIMVDE